MATTTAATPRTNAAGKQSRGGGLKTTAQMK